MDYSTFLIQCYYLDSFKWVLFDDLDLLLLQDLDLNRYYSIILIRCYYLVSFLIRPSRLEALSVTCVLFYF